MLVNAPVLTLPEAPCAPVHAPGAVHDVALVLDQLSVLDALEAILGGLAENVTVGAGTTDTVVDCVLEPLVPLHDRVNVVVAFNGPTVSVPEGLLVPLQPPDAVHELTFEPDQLNVLLPPLATLPAEAESATLGAEESL